jgi:L-seryl-tRNA(Ser) seleniumtransferase
MARGTGMNLEGDPYGYLGVRPVINVATTLTALGGSLMPAEVVEAMARAAASFVDLRELHERAGAELARLTDNEAAYVTNGCAGGIALAVLACITAGVPARIAALPGDERLPRNVVVHRAHRIPYDRAIELVGGHIVEIGNVIQTFEWELDAALDENAAAVFFVAGSHLPSAALSLETTVRIAHARGVPVIVDAAAQLPPASNLWSFTRSAGADVVLFSGGKGLRGPQSSGLMVGRESLIIAARENGSPNQRLARALKVSKEDICGLVAAVNRYVHLDHDREAVLWEQVVSGWQERLAGIPGVRAKRSFPNEAGQPVPRLAVEFDSSVLNVTAEAVEQRLWSGNPRIAVLRGPGESIYLSPDTLGNDAESVIVMDELIRAVGRPSREVATDE